MVKHVDQETQRRGWAATRRSQLLLALLVSVLLHVLPFPLYLSSAFWSQWFHPNDESKSDTETLEDHPTIIPIELGLEDEQQAAAQKAKAAQVTQLEEATGQKAGQTLVAEAGAPLVEDGGSDAAPSDAAADARAEGGVDAGRTQERPDGGAAHDGGAWLDAAVASRDRLDAGGQGQGPSSKPAPASSEVALITDAGPDAAPFEPIRDPIGLSGGAQAVAPKDPNVSLMVFADRIRQHPLGQQFAPVLTTIPQWNRFFAGTGLDPVQDTDRILLAGPQFRNTSRVVAVLRLNAPAPKIRAAVGALVQQSGPAGGWLDAGVPAAKAHVDRADRYFVQPAPNVLVIVPPDGLEQALRLPRNMRFPQSKNEAVVLFLKNPANAFRDFPLSIPASIEWMRFSLTVSADGGVDARLDAKDRDPQTATRNADALTDALNKALVVDLLFTRRRLIDSVLIRAEGDHLRSETHVTPGQLKTILSLIAAKVEQVAREEQQRPH